MLVSAPVMLPCLSSLAALTLLVRLMGFLREGGVNNPKVPLRFPSLVTSLLGTPSLLGSHKLLSVLL